MAIQSSKAEMYWGSRDASAPGAAAVGSPAASIMKQLNIFFLVLMLCLVVLMLVFTLLRIRRRRMEHRRAQQLAAEAAANQGLPAVLGSSAVAQWQAPGNVRKGFRAQEIELLGKCVSFEDYTLKHEGREDPKLECIVCLGEYKAGEALRELEACGHTFHRACVDAWLKRHSSCPLCRTELHCRKSDAGEHPSQQGGLGRETELGGERELGRETELGGEMELGRETELGGERELGREIQLGGERELGRETELVRHTEPGRETELDIDTEPGSEQVQGPSSVCLSGRSRVQRDHFQGDLEQG